MSASSPDVSLLDALDLADQLIRDCVAGDLCFADFLARYGNLYWAWALDRHEADDATKAMLITHAARIAVHRRVAEEILTRVCSESDAAQDSYRAAGRFGPIEARDRLQSLMMEVAPGACAVDRDELSAE